MKSVKGLCTGDDLLKPLLAFVLTLKQIRCRTVNIGSGAIEKYHKLSPFWLKLAISLTAKISSWLCETAEPRREALARF